MHNQSRYDRTFFIGDTPRKRGWGDHQSKKLDVTEKTYHSHWKSGVGGVRVHISVLRVKYNGSFIGELRSHKNKWQRGWGTEIFRTKDEEAESGPLDFCMDITTLSLCLIGSYKTKKGPLF